MDHELRERASGPLLKVIRRFGLRKPRISARDCLFEVGGTCGVWPSQMWLCFSQIARIACEAPDALIRQQEGPGFALPRNA